MANSPIRVLVADDHRVVRAGLVALLKQQGGIDIVGEAGSGREAVERAGELRPDVVLMDLQMPEMDGVEATKEIRSRWPSVEVLVLTTFDDDELIWRGIQAGARGYLLKDAPPEDLIQGIVKVASKETLLPPDIAAKLAHVIQRGGPAAPEGAEALTEREREILTLMAKGYANKQIGQALHISENTVKTHVSNIFQKLEANDRAEAVAKAIRLGAIEL